MTDDKSVLSGNKDESSTSDDVYEVTELVSCVLGNVKVPLSRIKSIVDYACGYLHGQGNFTLADKVGPQGRDKEFLRVQGGGAHAHPPHELDEWHVVLKPLNAEPNPLMIFMKYSLLTGTMPLRAETTASDTIVIINYHYMRDRPELYLDKRPFFKDQ